MPTSLDGRLIVALSSRALFDFEDENRVFEATDDRAYMQLQLQRLEQPAQAGVAFSLVNKLLAFNADRAPLVEVVILSRNDPVSGMRVFRSCQHYRLPIERGVFTRGQSPWRYLKPLNAHLFLSTNEADVRSALAAGVPAARVYPHSARASSAHPTEVRIAFDGDAVLFSDESLKASMIHRVIRQSCEARSTQDQRIQMDYPCISRGTSVAQRRNWQRAVVSLESTSSFDLPWQSFMPWE